MSLHFTSGWLRERINEDPDIESDIGCEYDLIRCSSIGEQAADNCETAERNRPSGPNNKRV